MVSCARAISRSAVGEARWLDRDDRLAAEQRLAWHPLAVQWQARVGHRFAHLAQPVVLRAGQRTAGDPRVLPAHVVAVFHRWTRQIEHFSAQQCSADVRELSGDDAELATVRCQVMDVQVDDLLTVGQAELVGAYEWPLRQVEGRGAIVAQPRVQPRPGCGPREPVQCRILELNCHLAGDHLDGYPVTDGEHGPQRRMAAHDSGQGGLDHARAAPCANDSHGHVEETGL